MRLHSTQSTPEGRAGTFLSCLLLLFLFLQYTTVEATGVLLAVVTGKRVAHTTVKKQNGETVTGSGRTLNVAMPPLRN